uniref:G-protein coupled receptors family 1 profile domain-containing protein n=1 Tax=Meloidogyne floridensis TaxID=298350 RepID=A0A915NM59_9BILA
IIGLEGIPVYTYFLINGQRWPFGAFLCDLWLSVDYACCLASIYTVLGITADRYLSVKYPAAYRNWRTKGRVLLIIAAIWVLPSVLFSISIFGYGWFSGKGRILREDECYVQFMTNPYLNAGMYLSYYWSTLILMLYLYYGIYSAAKQLASKSDQKQKRLAILAEMRGGEGGGQEVAIRPDSRDEQSLGPVLSEALGTLDSSETKPFRKASTRLLNAIQNGRLLSLRTKNAVNSSTSDGASSKADSLNTKEKCPKKLSINANNKEQNIIEPNKSTSLTLLGPNNETSNSLEQQQSQSLSPHKEGILEKRENSSEGGDGAFSPDFGDRVPFIDESAQSSAMSTPKDLREEEEKENKIPTRVGPNSFRSHSVPSSNQHKDEKTFIPIDCNNGLNGGCNNQTNVDNLMKEEKALPIFDKIPPQLQIRPSVITITQLNIHREITANFTEGIGGLRKWVDAARGGGRNVRTQSEKKRKQQKQKGQPHNRKFSKGSSSRSENRARKALRTITVILGTFTLFWTPFYVLATIYGFCERCSSSAGFQALYTVSYILCYMNSPINPLCYAAANQQFKRTFKRILRGDLHRN